MKSYLIPIVLAAVFALGLGLGQEPKEQAGPVVDASAGQGKFSNEHRFVFFAVLIGLYEDGVPVEAVELIVPDVDAMVDPKRPEQTNFVETCPLCAPAFDAFRAYKLRPGFYGQEGTKYNTFGFGLSQATMKGLRGSPVERRETIRQMIEGYVTRRLESTALRDEERIDMRVRLLDMKKEGHAALARVRRGEAGADLAKVYANWMFCPNCAGVAPDPEDLK